MIDIAGESKPETSHKPERNWRLREPIVILSLDGNVGGLFSFFVRKQEVISVVEFKNKKKKRPGSDDRKFWRENKEQSEEKTTGSLSEQRPNTNQTRESNIKDSV